VAEFDARPDPARLDLSVVIPVFNEESNLDELVLRCLQTCDSLGCRYELILVDDGSVDGSPAKIEKSIETNPGRVVGVLLNRNYGQHAAVLAGLEESRGAVVVTLDADLQNPPEEIRTLYEKIAEGFDVVGSVRTPRHDSLFRRLSSALTNRMVRAATGVDMHDYGCMLRAYRRPIVDAMLQCPERSTFIPVLANSLARSTAEVNVRHDARASGDSKYDLLKLVNLQFDLLTSMTTFPLRLLSIGGVISAALGIGFGALILVLRLVLGPEWASEGVFTLLAILFIFIGAQLVGMGLLGEYLGRVYQNVQARPRYFVSRVVGRGSHT